MKNDDKKIQYVKIRETDHPKNVRNSQGGAALKRLTPLQGAKHVGSVIGTTLLTIFLILVITVCIVAVAIAVYVMQFAENSFDIDLKDVELSVSSLIYATNADGEDVELKQLHTDENRVWVDIDDLQQHTIDAFVAVEDRRFFEHRGVDWGRTVKVTVDLLFSGGTAGGSTITQQLVRDVTKDNKTNVGRKLREIFRALSLEQKYNKLDILESYLNRVGFGGTSYGIGSASQHYFDKDASELTIAESALLAGILRSPGSWNPYANPAKARERELYGLGNMHDYGYITTEEYNKSKAEKIRFRRPIAGDDFGYEDERYNDYYNLIDSANASNDEDLYYENVSWEELNDSIPYKWSGNYEVTQSYYVDAAINQVIQDFAKKLGTTEASAKEMFYKGGYRVYLNVDLDMQEKLEKKFEDPYTCLNGYDPNASKENLLQAGFLIMDHHGNVKAVAGAIGEKEGDGAYNRATQSYRSPGSTIKPLSVYSPAIDNNIVTYSTMIPDVSGEILKDNARTMEDRERWPYNYQQLYTPGTGDYYPVVKAVQKSTNTIAVRVLSMLGRDTAFSQLTNVFGFEKLDPVNDFSWSPLALGGFTEGVTLLELTSAYQIMGNGGIYYKPYFYSKVEDSNGKIVLQQDYSGIQAISSASAWITNRMMKAVVDDYSGTGQHAKLPNVEVVGKTGTANDMSNLIFAGLTPEYVACYRIGYDSHKTVEEYNQYTGWKTVARVWHDVMIEVIDTSVEQSFVPDSSVLNLPYCTETGLLATSICPSTAIGYYKSDNVPSSCNSKHSGGDYNYWEIYGDKTIPFYP